MGRGRRRTLVRREDHKEKMSRYQGADKGTAGSEGMDDIRMGHSRS